jgi:hypothetical protein
MKEHQLDGLQAMSLFVQSPMLSGEQAGWQEAHELLAGRAPLPPLLISSTQYRFFATCVQCTTSPLSTMPSFWRKYKL